MHLREVGRSPFDPVVLSACAAVALVVAFILVDSLVPDAPRLRFSGPPGDWITARQEQTAWPRSRDVPLDRGWAEFVYAYATLCSLLVAASAGCLVAALRSRTALRAAADRLKSGEAALALEDRSQTSPTILLVDRARRELDSISQARQDRLQPLAGFLAVSGAALLVATLVTAKLDLPWARLVLPPPVVISQSLQHAGASLAVATVRTLGNLLQGCAIGFALGLGLGFLLGGSRWLQKATEWHIVVLAATPPLVLAEILKPAVALAPLLVPQSELGFKIGIGMSAWATTWPVLTATALALSRIDPEYRRSLNLLGAYEWRDRLQYLELPTALPGALSNLRIGVAIGLIVLLHGEGYGSSPQYPSLGAKFSDITQNGTQLGPLFALLGQIGLIILLIEGSLRFANRKLSRRRGRGAAPAAWVEPRTSGDERRALVTQFEDRLRAFLQQEPDFATGSASAPSEAVAFSCLSKTYDDGPKAFNSAQGQSPAFRYHVNRGEVVSIIGRSGAGKSTLVKLLLGFERPDAAEGLVLNLGGLDLTDPTVGDEQLVSRVSYVTQRPSLIPHLTVAQNLMFGLRQQSRLIRRLRDSQPAVARRYEVAARWLLGGQQADEWAWPMNKRQDVRAAESPLGLLVRFMGLDDRMGALPSELSGGEAQRLHLLRWLVLFRPILVIDEAFSALDQPLKGMVRDLVIKTSRETGTTVVNVSHDRVDVLQVSKRVWFVHEGRITEKAPPAALYYEPYTKDLAVFLGHTNLFRGCREPGAIRLDQDLYRGIDLGGLELRVGEAAQDEVPLGKGEWFIPRTYVNLSLAADAMPMIVLDARFSGTHVELVLGRRGTPLQLEAVVQDDDLQALCRELAPGFVGRWVDLDRLRGAEIKVALRAPIRFRD